MILSTAVATDLSGLRERVISCRDTPSRFICILMSSPCRHSCRRDSKSGRSSGWSVGLSTIGRTHDRKPRERTTAAESGLLQNGVTALKWSALAVPLPTAARRACTAACASPAYASPAPSTPACDCAGVDSATLCGGRAAVDQFPVSLTPVRGRPMLARQAAAACAHAASSYATNRRSVSGTPSSFATWLAEALPTKACSAFRHCAVTLRSSSLFAALSSVQTISREDDATRTHTVSLRNSCVSALAAARDTILFTCRFNKSSSSPTAFSRRNTSHTSS
mmetsp:Transcript_33370/g.83833  ORF Transcript_33370/g.83833 Transcript_33370/m.83833 type:complete len:279 (+) Transcript_33370:636-1472(+)